MAPDSVLTPDGTSLHVTYTPEATTILVGGYLGIGAIARLDEALASVPDDSAAPVLLRITSTELEFGAGDALRRVLTSRRMRGSHRLAVWAVEPLVRRGIPLPLLHATPPHPSGNWDIAVPLPP